MHAASELAPTIRTSRSRTIAVLLLCALGYGLTLYVFYPGVMTLDARYIFNDMNRGFYGDWQSPVMSLLWKAINPIAPRSTSMFLTIITLYWLAFGLIGIKIAQVSWLGVALPLLAVSPPAFILVGIIWRDVLFGSAWLLAAALVFATTDKPVLRRWALGLAIVLLVFGVLLRPNSVPAAPFLAAYLLWPARWSFKRIAVFFVPALLAFMALVPTVYYGILDVKRQHPLHQILVFDLGGITHFAKENQFPVEWTAEQSALLTSRCYQAEKWDHYWYIQPCLFVMGRLEGDKIFGTDTLVEAWKKAVLKHPIAYLQHRAAFMMSLLTGFNLVLWTEDIENPPNIIFSGRPAFMTLVAINDALRPTWLFKTAMWFALCLVLCALGWRKRDTPTGAFVLGTCGSGVAFIVTYFFVGVASDYRYSYWAVLAALCSSVVLLPQTSRGASDTA